MTNPSDLDLGLSALAAARLDLTVARDQARRRLADEVTVDHAEALAAVSTALRLTEAALAVVTGVDDPADLDDVVDDPAVPPTTAAAWAATQERLADVTKALNATMRRQFGGSFLG